MKKAIVAISMAVFLTSVLLVSCGGVLTGSGNLKTEEYTFTDFHKVEISSAFEFDIRQSGSYGVSITADDNVIEKVQVTKEGNTLKIGLGTIPRLGPVTLQATVTMPQLRSLAVSGASRGAVYDFSSAEDVNITLSGASKVAGDLTAGNVNFSGASTGTINLSGKLDANLSGASKLSYIGEPTMGTINTSGGSTLSKK
jgi:hypothetical protein